MAHHDLTHDQAGLALMHANLRTVRSLYEANFFMRFWRTHSFCPGIRAEAARYFYQGERVLEIGCGSGKNFPHLMRRLGPDGKLYATDFSKKMVAGARRRIEANGWQQRIELAQESALTYEPRGPLDGILFAWSYEVIPERAQREALLRRLVPHLRSGGRIVVADVKRPDPRSALHEPAKEFARGFYGSDPNCEGAWLEIRKLLGHDIHQMRLHAFDYYTFSIVIP